MRANPKHPLSVHFAEDIERYVEKAMRRTSDPMLSLGIEWEDKGKTIVLYPGSSGGNFAYVLPKEKIFGVRGRNFFGMPTVVHVLYQIFSRYPHLFAGYSLREHAGTFGGGSRHEWKDTGYTVERFMDEVHLVHEESVVRHGREPEEDESKVFDYFALHGPQEMTWYHATLKGYVPSIEKKGLLPSGLGAERVEGWSPSWNMHIQRAVYLTSSEAYARDIAETIAERASADAVVLVVDGAGLRDTRLLTYDEDALRDDDGAVHYDNFDRDFPQWVSGQESSVRSIGYLGPILPQYVHILATARYSEEDVDDYREQKRSEITWDDQGSM